MPHKHPTILVVEDNTGIGLVVQSLLEGESYRVLLADSIPEAIASLQEEEVHLVLTDGFSDTPDGVRESVTPLMSAADGVPVALMTAHQVSPRTAEAWGFCALIPKPFDFDAFLDNVRHCLKGVRASPANA
jgi:DNA-binding NtrC family response regulator